MDTRDAHREHARRSAQLTRADLHDFRTHLSCIRVRHHTLSSPHRLGV